MSNLDNPEISKLLTLVEEAARSTDEGVKRFIEPAEGTLRRAVTKRHHIIFGRRGSGKSSLLRKAASNLTVDRRPIAYVDLETFKSHSYPDVLLSVLISTFKEFNNWLATAAIHPATKTTFWTQLFGTKPSRAPFDRKGAEKLTAEIQTEIAKLESQLHSADNVETNTASKQTSDTKLDASVKAKLKGGGMEASSSIAAAESQGAAKEVKQVFKTSKVDFLHRNILKYQEIFRNLKKLSDGDAYLFLDDLYHIRRSDQPQLIDYFHKISKGNHLWLKIGTIRHRTAWYIHGDPPIGIKLGDDADEIDLDLTLEKYSLAKTFLAKILRGFTEECVGINIPDLLTDGAVDRLVLASGGVARDFLAIFRKAVDVAKERGDNHRGAKIGSEDVNVAAGEHETSKREELKRDAPDAQDAIEKQFGEIVDFCLEKAGANLFLVEKKATGLKVDLIHELVDLRLVHLISSRLTVSKRPGAIFEGYMLDVSQYTGARKRRDFDILEFWKPEKIDELRRVKLIYET